MWTCALNPDGLATPPLQILPSKERPKCYLSSIFTFDRRHCVLENAKTIEIERNVLFCFETTFFLYRGERLVCRNNLFLFETTFLFVVSMATSCVSKQSFLFRNDLLFREGSDLFCFETTFFVVVVVLRGPPSCSKNACIIPFLCKTEYFYALL